MSGFKTSYVNVRIYRWTKKESDRNELLSDLIYESKDNGLIVIPKGFKTDFASIPRIFHSIISPNGKWILAAILHDYLYSEGYRLGISRKQADKIFYEAMIDSFVARITANIMWACVRLFAFKHYNKG